MIYILILSLSIHYKFGCFF